MRFYEINTHMYRSQDIDRHVFITFDSFSEITFNRISGALWVGETGLKIHQLGIDGVDEI